MPTSPKGKQITKFMRLSEQGVNLIQRIVLSMDFMWYSTGAVEAGIDGWIELINPSTNEALNSIILVQSKATLAFEAETATSLQFTCKERDIKYWVQGNAPVIIVVSRPSTDEAYWVSIRDYFKDIATLKSRKIRFDKQLNRFDESCKDALLNLGVSRDSGIYFAPPPKTERLYSNLLQVTRFPDTIYAAETQLREPQDLLAALSECVKYPSRLWFLHDKRIYSFHNLAEPPWTQVCDTSTTEEIPSVYWAASDDPVTSRHFVRLLKEALYDQLGPRRIRYSKKHDCLYFQANKDLSPRRYRYKSFQRWTPRVVVGRYGKDDDKPIYRHNAFIPAFRRFDGVWYLEITPTYYFTIDGKLPWRFYEEWLKGIKRIEKNAAVVGQVIMWARFLTRPADLFDSKEQHLQFGELQEFTLDVGIKDALWSPTEQALEAERQAKAALGILDADIAEPEEEDDVETPTRAAPDNTPSNIDVPRQLPFSFN